MRLIGGIQRLTPIRLQTALPPSATAEVGPAHYGETIWQLKIRNERLICFHFLHIGKSTKHDPLLGPPECVSISQQKRSNLLGYPRGFGEYAREDMTLDAVDELVPTT